MDIPRLPWDSPDVANFITSGKPVVLLNCPLSSPVAGIWSPEYLSSLVAKEYECTVFSSTSNRFQYWDSSKNNGYNFTAPTQKLEISFDLFLKNLKDQSSVTSPSTCDAPSRTTKYYLQSSVVAEMGPRMMEEYTKFSLEAALRFKLQGKWDAFSANLLLVGPAGAITPCHFDEQQNLFAQVYGRKRVRLFPPEAWRRLYPYPLSHACDRQTRVVLPTVPGARVLDDERDRARFPAYARYADDPDAQELYVDLRAGEILYIPQYWFHQMEALEENVSLSWWFKHTSRNYMGPDGVIDLTNISYVAMRRNLEGVVAKSVGGGRGAHNFFLGIAAGRIPLPRSFPVNGPPPPSRGEVTYRADYAHYEDVIPADREDFDSHNVSLPAGAPELAVQALQLTSVVLGPERASAFLKELASGRFAGL